MENKLKRENRSKDKNTRLVLLFLFIFLTVLGVWKYPNFPSDKKIASEIVPKKEVNLDIETLEKPNMTKGENPPPSIKKEVRKESREEQSVPLKTKEESVSNTPTYSKTIVPKKTKIEETFKTREERTASISDEKSFQKETIVYTIDKKIDKRLPASSDNSCQATTLFKISKSTIQTSVAIAPDGSNFAVGNHNNYVGVMNTEGKELFKLIGHSGYVQSIKYAPDGKWMVTGSMDKTAKIWDATDGKEIRSLKGHTEGILSVAYSLNGKYIATGSLDHTTMLWEAKSGKQLFQLVGHNSEISEVAFSANSKFVITGSSDGTAKVWDVENGKILYSLNGHDGVVGGVAFTPTNKLIVTSSKDKIRVWNTETGKHIHTINDDDRQIMSIFISNDGAYISSSTVNGLIKIWKVKGGKKICEYQGHSKSAREAIFHPTMKNTVISAGNDHTIRMWKFEGR